MSRIESVHVTVTDSVGNGCKINGTNADQYICGDLISAMNVSCEQSDLTIYINTSSFVYLGTYEFFLNCPVSWVGIKSDCTIECVPQTSLVFTSNISAYWTHSISFSSFTLSMCGNYPGIRMTGLAGVFFDQINFITSTVSLLNIPQIDSCSNTIMWSDIR